MLAAGIDVVIVLDAQAVRCSDSVFLEACMLAENASRRDLVLLRGSNSWLGPRRSCCVWRMHARLVDNACHRYWWLCGSHSWSGAR